MDAEKLISSLNGMIRSADYNPKTDDWVKDFLIEVKSTLEEQQEEIKRLETELMMLR